MKKLFCMIMLLSIPLFAQENLGKISLLFNGEKMDVPVSGISLKKDKEIRISANAFLNSEGIQQDVQIELAFSKFPEKENEGFNYDGFKFTVRTRDNKNLSGQELNLNFQGQELHYTSYKRNERSSWDGKQLHMILNIDAARFENGHMTISGTLSGKFGTTEGASDYKLLAEIKDGKFILII